MVYQNKLALFLPSMTKISDFIRIKKASNRIAHEKWRDRRFVQSKKMALRRIKEKKMNFKAWNVKNFRAGSWIVSPSEKSIACDFTRFRITRRSRNFVTYSGIARSSG